MYVLMLVKREVKYENYESRGGSSDYRLPTSNFQLPISDFRLPTSVAMKGGDRPTRLLPYAKMLLVPQTFFFPSAG